jgi:hypothetical protein
LPVVWQNGKVVETCMTTECLRPPVAEQRVSEAEALQRAAKSKQIVEKSAEVYPKA